MNRDAGNSHRSATNGSPLLQDLVAGQIASSPVALGSILPFVQSGGQLSFCLIGPLSERNSIVVATRPAFGAWLTVFGDAKMTTTMLDRITSHGKPPDNQPQQPEQP